MNNYGQFLLANGLEIVAEILEDDEELNDMVVRNCLIISRMNVKEGTYYIFRPMMTYVEGENGIIGLNRDHITASSIPHIKTIDQYYFALQKMKEEWDEEMQEYEQPLENEKNLDELDEELTEEDKEKIVSIFKNSKPTMH